MSMLRNFMSHKVRSNAGCWTCRLRRKKCDERRPVCDGCGALEITCHFDDGKPDWMDGGPKQKAMADKIKMQVKKQASQRRDRKYMEILRNGSSTLDGEDQQGQYDVQHQHSHHDDHRHHPPLSRDATAPDAPFSHLEKNMTPPSSCTSGASPDEIPSSSNQFFDPYQHKQLPAPPPLSHQQQQQQQQLQQQQQQQQLQRLKLNEEEDTTNNGVASDVHFVMIYLDYVFPYLFPHYRPAVLAGGRGWVLDKLQSSKTVYHTAISLASYFFGIMLAHDDADHEACVARMGEMLQVQVEKGLRELQKEMATVNAMGGDGFRARDGLLVMQSITQMVVFELATTNKETWRVHLEAAFAMFARVLPDPSQWADILEGLYTPRWPPAELGGRRPWSTDQAALRFDTANLMLMDVMASITLERAPRLQRYHDAIIPGLYSESCRANAQTVGPIFMDDFTGLHNWVVRVIGDVAALDAWRKEKQQQLCKLSAWGAACAVLDHDEFHARARVLVDSINAALPGLDQQADYQKAKTMLANIVEDPFSGIGTVVTENLQGFHPILAALNALWLRATLIYLYTVVHGWRPDHPDIRPNVIALTTVLEGMRKSSCLRGLSWPFFVAGCLAPAEDEDIYRKAIGKMGPLQVFGTIKEAFEIMQKVWSCRDQLDETWDFAQCLRILGHRSLLT